jgi:hypothetical protein
MLYDLALLIPQTNLMALGISIFSMVFLFIGREYINPWVKKRFFIPIPFDLILVRWKKQKNF